MKTLGKFVMLLAILVICVPAHGDILIYNKTLKWQCAEVGGIGNDDIFKETIKGFLILDVTFTAGEITSINDAIQIIYITDDGEKTAEFSPHSLNFRRYNDGGMIAYGFTEFVSSDADFCALILMGLAKYENIGNAAPNEVPKQLTGYAIEHEDGNFSEGCTYALRLNTQMTKQANQGDMDLEAAYDLVRAWVENKGHTGLPADLPEE